MAARQHYCKRCGSPMKPQDGALVCSLRGAEHPVLRRRGTRDLGRREREGGWTPALVGLGLTTLVGGGGLVLLAPLLAPEPLVLTLVLVPVAFLIGFATLFGWRMYRPDPETWAREPWYALLALLSALPVVGLELLLLPHGATGAGYAAVAGLAWASGTLGAYLPHGKAAPTPGLRLARALRAAVGAHGRSLCDVADCEHVGIACRGAGCRQVRCGTHWIQADGRCGSCGTSFIPPARPPRPRLVPYAIAALTVLAMALGALWGGGHG